MILTFEISQMTSRMEVKLEVNTEKSLQDMWGVGNPNLRSDRRLEVNGGH